MMKHYLACAMTALAFISTTKLIEASTTCSWQVFTPPNAGGFNTFDAVDVVSAADVWAGGQFVTEKGNAFAQLLHFDGAQWAISKMPKLKDGAIDGIAHFAANDVWAVGWEVNRKRAYRSSDRALERKNVGQGFTP